MSPVSLINPSSLKYFTILFLSSLIGIAVFFLDLFLEKGGHVAKMHHSPAWIRGFQGVFAGMHYEIGVRMQNRINHK